MIRFKRNMAMWDRGLRFTVGAIMWTVGPLSDIVQTDLLSNILLATVGTLAIGSALSAYCFLYDLTGLQSAKK